MAKYHVNTITGDYGVCKAGEGNCPLAKAGEAEHYGDKEEAEYQSEVILGAKLGLFDKKQKVALPNVNTSYSFPQADRLDRLAETVDAIGLGSTTSSSLSESISAVSRQALYYADAAGYLGLVEHSKNAKGEKVYNLTKSGKSFVEGSAEDRDNIFRHSIKNVPAVAVYQEKGEKAAVAFIKETESVNEETVGRRITTIKGWAAKLQHTDKLVNYDNELSERGSNAKEKSDLVGEMCMGCFTYKSIAGTCSCDE